MNNVKTKSIKSTEILTDGSGKYVEWYANYEGVASSDLLEHRFLHRENGPAVQYLNNKVEKWYQHGLLHRENGPAICAPGGGPVVSPTSDLSVSTRDEIHECVQQAWVNRDQLHREDGPALIKKRDDYQSISYFVFGQLHRVDGPAQISINLRTKTETHEYYINDEYVGEVVIYPAKKNKPERRSWCEQPSQENRLLMAILQNQKMREAQEQKQEILFDLVTDQEIDGKVKKDVINKRKL